MKKHFYFRLVLIIIFLGCATILTYAQTQLVPNKKFYLDREKKAPVLIVKQLDSLRLEITKNKYLFEVGYTTVADKDINSICGVKVPENFEKEAQVQTEIYNRYIETEENAKKDYILKNPTKSKSLAEVYPLSCASLGAFDWLHLHCVTPVRDQDGCGSCWIFGTIGAFEGSWAIRHLLHPLINSSEQFILNCCNSVVGSCGSCGGGWPAKVAQFLVTRGTTTETLCPYIHVDASCVPKPIYYKAVTWNYVGGTTPTVAQLKDALCKYGPLSVCVTVTSAFQHYIGGVFNEHSTYSINHCVTLVGWNDNALGTGTGAWLIKNSWGTGWGMGGYMWIAYNSNHIGSYALWVLAQPWWPLFPMTSEIKPIKPLLKP